LSRRNATFPPRRLEDPRRRPRLWRGARFPEELTPPTGSAFDGTARDRAEFRR
jgi:hypothetical protein